MAKKVLIVGGVAAGASAAARLRRLDENLEITILEKGRYVSFANCGLPYYVGNKIQDRDDLILQTPESLNRRFKLDVRVNSEVTSVDFNSKSVKVLSNGEESSESYDVLVLTPGAKPARPPISGIDSERVLTVRTVGDVDRFQELIKSSQMKSVVVVGGGFIGLEMAENLLLKGIKVTLVEAAERILPPVDAEIAELLQLKARQMGIELYTANGVERFEETPNGIATYLKNGERLTSDYLLLAIGVKPDTDFLKGSGIELNERGYILTDSHLRTNIENVYAAGDAILVYNFVADKMLPLALAGPANKQGRVVADNIAGLNSEFKGVQGSSVLKFFDLTVAFTGMSEKFLKNASIPCRAATVHPASHASYYPGASPITLRLIFSTEDGKVLGAQAIGREGVEKRIDVIATAIKFGATVDSLTELELSYAPPFSSAKDPVNMAAFVAQNYLKKIVDLIDYRELNSLDPDSYLLLDVRTPMEFNMGHLPNAVNIPVDQLRTSLNSLDPSKPIVAYCQVGFRGYIASRILTQNGFNVKNLSGGYRSASLFV